MFDCVDAAINNAASWRKCKLSFFIKEESDIFNSRHKVVPGNASGLVSSIGFFAPCLCALKMSHKLSHKGREKTFISMWPCKQSKRGRGEKIPG